MRGCNVQVNCQLYFAGLQCILAVVHLQQYLSFETNMENLGSEGLPYSTKLWQEKTLADLELQEIGGENFGS